MKKIKVYALEEVSDFSKAYRLFGSAEQAKEAMRKEFSDAIKRGHPQPFDKTWEKDGAQYGEDQKYPYVEFESDEKHWQIKWLMDSGYGQRITEHTIEFPDVLS